MKTNLSNENGSELAVYTFYLRFEGAADIALETSGYWFDAEGRLLDGADTTEGKLSLVLSSTELRRGRLLVVPISSDGFHARRVTAEDLLAYDAFEPRARFDPLLRYQTLPDIPEPVWRFWFMSRGFGLPDPRSVRAAIQSW
jgi:hypothetical protein